MYPSWYSENASVKSKELGKKPLPKAHYFLVKFPWLGWCWEIVEITVGVVCLMSSTPSLSAGLGIVPYSWVSSSLSSPLLTDSSDTVLIFPSGEFLLICPSCHSTHKLLELLIKIPAPPKTYVGFQWVGYYSVRVTWMTLCLHPSASSSQQRQQERHSLQIYAKAGLPF